MPRSDALSNPAVAPLDIDKVRQQLIPRRLAVKLHYFAELGSTNTRAREFAEGGALEGEVVVADAQTQGRGRLGRRWESPARLNLYFSIILRPRLAPVHAAQITLMAAIALAEALDAFIAPTAEIKWPNDILVGGRKLAGVLTEAACSAGAIEHVILGIGINVNYRRDEMPAEIRARATSLADLSGAFVARENVLARLIHALDRCYGVLEQSGFDALRPRWEARFGLRGKRVRIEHLDQVIVGRARGIAPDGALLVEDESGALHNIYAGDVIALEN
jgi:BirA family biotin operon repressor/biotin-[acetyl-CoA-carboxylase] ligase